MTEITINFTYIFAVMYAVFKGVASVWICKREFQYPIWNKEGVQISRGLHHKLQAFLRNWAINPEWGLLKAVAFGPVFIVTGKRHIHAFMPWKVHKVPAFCQQCSDKGKYYTNSFVVGEGGWHTCECRNKTTPQEQPTCNCRVCLDTGTIGKSRPCPHCERRGILVRHAQAEVKRSNINNIEQCCNCGKEDEIENFTVSAQGRWFCNLCVETSGSQTQEELNIKVWSKCNECGGSFVVGTEGPPGYLSLNRCMCKRCYTRKFVKDVILSDKVQENPHRYLTKFDYFIGDPHEMKKCSGSMRLRLCRRQPTEINVGDSILIQAVPSGHFDQSKLGTPLRVLGVNLPFLVVECSAKVSRIRCISALNVRGMVIYSERSTPITIRAEYQPLLNPAFLEVGDKFVIMNVHEKKRDASWRGYAFRVTKTAYSCHAAHPSIAKGADVIEAEQLSFSLGISATELRCDDLQIIAVNDQYINASKTSCPDSGLGGFA